MHNVVLFWGKAVGVMRGSGWESYVLPTPLFNGGFLCVNKTPALFTVFHIVFHKFSHTIKPLLALVLVKLLHIINSTNKDNNEINNILLLGGVS